MSFTPAERFSTLSPAEWAIEQLRLVDHFIANLKPRDLALLHAVRAAHSALTAALVCAVADTHGSDAYAREVRDKHFQYLHSPEQSEPLLEMDDRVLGFWHLIAVGKRKKVFTLDESENRHLEVLTDVRDRIEHIRPGRHSFHWDALLAALIFCVQLTVRLITGWGHTSLEQAELERLLVSEGRILLTVRRELESMDP